MENEIAGLLAVVVASAGAVVAWVKKEAAVALAAAGLALLALSVAVKGL